MKKVYVSLIIVFLLSLLCFGQEFDGYIVKLKENTVDSMSTVSLFSDNADLVSDMNDSDVAELLADELPNVSQLNTRHLLLKADNMDAVQELVELDIVDYYEENFYLELFSYDIDANVRYSNQWYLDYINAEYAWNIGVFGEGVTVGVIDSGVYRHNDLTANLLDGINYDSTVGTTCNTDNNNHGTMVAGIIAAECNDIGHVGVSFKSKVVPLRVMHPDGGVSVASAASAIRDAVDLYGCQVVNLSFGSSSPSRTLYESITYAINDGVIVVAAAGNYGHLENPPQYPAYYPEVISVGNACRNNNTLSVYYKSTYNENVDIVAPATSIEGLRNVNNDYGLNGGTSFASPMVAAAAALAKSVDPTITQYEFEELIKSTADTSYIASSGQTSQHWGAGVLDVEAMMRELVGEERVFVSDTFTVGTENFVNITNISMTDDIQKGFVVITDYDGTGSITKTMTKEQPIGKNTTVSYSLTQLGFSKYAEVEYVLSHVPGDINGDGAVDIMDATVIRRLIAGHEHEGIVKDALDVNGDGSFDILDASTILRYCAGYDVELH